MFKLGSFWAFTSMTTLAFAVACTHATDTNEAGENMLAAISDADRENSRHADACDAASSMGDMMVELSQHESTMDSIVVRMDDAQDHMRMGSMMSMHCSGSSFDEMSSGLSAMHTEMASHDERMRSAASLGLARDECLAHTDAMREMMQGMHDDVENMPCMRM
jgi:hypothetical protein